MPDETQQKNGDMPSVAPCESCRQDFNIVQMHGVCVPGLEVRWLCPPCNDMFWRVVHHFNPPAGVEA